MANHVGGVHWIDGLARLRFDFQDKGFQDRDGRACLAVIDGGLRSIQLDQQAMR